MQQLAMTIEFVFEQVDKHNAGPKAANKNSIDLINGSQPMARISLYWIHSGFIGQGQPSLTHSHHH